MVKITFKLLVKIIIVILVALVWFFLAFFAHSLYTGGFSAFDLGMVTGIVSGIGYGFFAILAVSNGVLSCKLVPRAKHPRLFWGLAICSLVLVGAYSVPFFTVPGVIASTDTQFGATFGPGWNDFPADVSSTRWQKFLSRSQSSKCESSCRIWKHSSSETGENSSTHAPDGRANAS
ncbi:MAG TPA: hypothetical protein VKK79_23865, partial [Candidatus Lokiarchaeia archaeon]|nr:hypothetical protein [Candidatus Lokiarchaeia archaeon]